MKNLFLGTALCALVVTGCSKQDEAEPATPEQGKAVNVTINATRHETPSTRTEYEEGKDKLIVKWNSDKNDKLGVFARNNDITDNAEFTVRELFNDGKKVKFMGQLTVSKPGQDTKFYGYYPYSSTAGTTPTAIPIDLGSQTQTGITDQASLAHLATNDYMAATPVTERPLYGTLSLSLEFNPLLTIMSFEIKQVMKVQSIKLEAVGTTNLTPFYTEGTVNITTDDKTFPIADSGAAQSSVELSVTEGTIADGATGMFNMMIFPIAADKMPTTLMATVTTADGVVYTQIKKVPEEGFERGGRYIMGLNDLKSNKWGGTYPAAKADAAYSGGKGTEADPYLLASAEDFAQFAANGEKNSKDKFFHLTTDIDLAGQSWTPITQFFGNFDGKGHTISNLKVDISSKGGSAGLFAKIEDATIANLHITGTVKTNEKEDSYAGGICGHSGETCTISGCSFSGSVTGGVSGGICGVVDSESSITACRNMGSVTGGLSSGGILGESSGFAADATITACYNEGKIALSDNSVYFSKHGGIVSSGAASAGLAGAGSATVTACYNTYIDANLPNIVFGEPEYFKVEKCYAVDANADDQESIQKATLFSADAWPIATNNDAWTIATDAPGSENQYWKSIGGWNNGTPKHPKLWWEKE